MQQPLEVGSVNGISFVQLTKLTEPLSNWPRVIFQVSRKAGSRRQETCSSFPYSN